MDQTTVDSIAAYYLAGHGTKATARHVGRAYGTVRKVLVRRGLLRTVPYGSVADTVLADIRTRWEAGQSQSVIGRAVGLRQLKISRLLIRMGIRTERRNTGPQHGAWKGGRYLDTEGYSHVWVPPDDALRVMADSSGYVLEHRLVMARALGRPLRPWETVHHVNGARGDNGPENLQLRQGRHGNGVVARCADCGSSNVIAGRLAG